MCNILYTIYICNCLLSYIWINIDVFNSSALLHGSFLPPPLVYLQILTLRGRKWLLPFTIHTDILQAALRSRLIRRKMLFGRNKSWKTDPVKLTFNSLRFTTITTECTGVVTCWVKSPEQLRGAILVSECFCGVLRAEKLAFPPGSAAEILALVAYII